MVTKTGRQAVEAAGWSWLTNHRIWWHYEGSENGGSAGVWPVRHFELARDDVEGIISPCNTDLQLHMGTNT
jgi:hypothetical protein